MKEEYVLFIRIVLAHVMISYIVNRIPYRHLEKMRKHLQVGEAEMRFYEKVCRIRKWKDHIPSAGPFDKRKLENNSIDYFSLFILETVRAEIAHALCIIAAMSILVSSPLPMSHTMALFFLMINIPCIMIQRYNRPRLERILMRKGGSITASEYEIRGIRLHMKED